MGQKTIERGIYARIGSDGKITSYQVRIRKHGVAFSQKFATLLEARRFLLDNEETLRAGKPLPIKDSLSVYLTRVIDGEDDKKRKSQLRQVIGLRPSQKPLNVFHRGDAMDLRDELLESDRQESTVHRILVAVQGAVSVLVNAGRLTENPFKTKDFPPSGDGRDRRVSDDEILSLISYCESQATCYAIVLAVETAMRRGELAKLTWDRVDVDAGYIRLRPQDTKTKTGRVVRLSTVAKQVLSGLDRDSETVLGLRPDSITQAFGRAVHRWKPDEDIDLRFHDLRHEATSRLFELGNSVMQVKAMTGHKTLGMLSRYTHLRPDDIILK